MAKRILTAVVLMPAVAALVLWAPSWLFLLGLLPFAFLGLWEFLELAGRMGAAPSRLPVYLVGFALWLAALYGPRHLWAILVGGCLMLFALAMFRRSLRADILAVSATGAFGLIYVALPFALILDLRGAGQGRWALLYLLVLIWVGDSAAYFGGRALGRHKLAPTVSPGKTIEGTIVSVLATVAVGYWLLEAWFEGVGSIHGWLLPLAVNSAGQVGDLAESALKRSAGVKDSSTLIPGHGGVLDRVDALLFAAPVLWYYWKLL